MAYMRKLAICINNKGYSIDLRLGKAYGVLRAKAGDKKVSGYIRIVDESGEDYLYPQKRFIIVHADERSAGILQQGKFMRYKG